MPLRCLAFENAKIFLTVCVACLSGRFRHIAILPSCGHLLESDVLYLLQSKLSLPADNNPIVMDTCFFFFSFLGISEIRPSGFVSLMFFF